MLQCPVRRIYCRQHTVDFQRVHSRKSSDRLILIEVELRSNFAQMEIVILNWNSPELKKEPHNKRE